MKHNWEPTVSKEKWGDMSNYGRRKCVNCGAEQTKEVQQSWMVVTGYRWEPLVGRCQGKK
jgi:hypothetical protein